MFHIVKIFVQTELLKIFFVWTRLSVDQQNLGYKQEMVVDLKIAVSRRQWTDCIIDKIFKNIEIVKFITTALKSI